MSGRLLNLNRKDNWWKVSGKFFAPEPNNPYYLVRKTIEGGRTGRFEESLKLWDKFIQLEPNEATYWTGKGLCLAGLDRNDKALEALDKATSLNSNSGVAWSIKGIVQAELKQYDSAIASLTRTDKAYDRAWVYALKGDKTNALAELKWAIEKEPIFKVWAKKDERFKTLQSDPDFKKLTWESKFDEALKALEKAPVVEPNNETVLKEEFRTLMDSNQVDEGLKVCDKLVSLGPNDPNRWQFKKMVLAETGRWEDALKVSDKLIQLQPDEAGKSIGYWTGRGQILIGLNRNEEALKALDKAIAIDPNSSDAWSAKGAVQGRMKNYDEAVVSCNKAVKLSSPDYVERFVYGRACVYALKGDKTSALADLKRAIELKPSLKKQAKKDENYKTLQSDPDFKKLTE